MDMRRNRSKDKKHKKQIAQRRINQLFTLAEWEAHRGNLALSDRYVKLARRISMRLLVPIPIEFKRHFCPHCYRFFLPAVTCRVRIRHKQLTLFCFHCQRFTRIPFSGKQSSPSARLK